MNEEVRNYFLLHNFLILTCFINYGTIISPASERPIGPDRALKRVAIEMRAISVLISRHKEGAGRIMFINLLLHFFFGEGKLQFAALCLAGSDLRSAIYSRIRQAVLFLPTQIGLDAFCHRMWNVPCDYRRLRAMRCPKNRCRTRTQTQRSTVRLGLSLRRTVR